MSKEIQTDPPPRVVVRLWQSGVEPPPETDSQTTQRDSGVEPPHSKGTADVHASRGNVW